MFIEGFRRPEGEFGIRNKVLILSTVGCANETAKRIADQVEGAVFVPNTKGCGQIGGAVEIMKRSMVGLACNPNIFGTLIVGLGCETTQAAELYERISKKTKKPLHAITIQEVGGTIKTIERGVSLAFEMARSMSKMKREQAPLSSLVLATNCGGSDATSGLSANPVLGYVSDKLVAQGGTVFLGETTELIGAEHLLAARCKNDEVRGRLLKIVGELEQDFKNLGVDVRGANPTPGNMRGGLTTLDEKSLGGISKGGSSTVNEVVPYGVCPKEKGLIIMDTPGYDIESVTGMAAGGAQLCIFTTGRGNPIGNAIVPMIKIIGNAETYALMKDNMDLDVSGILTEGKSVSEYGEILAEKMISVCNGELTRAEILGFGEVSVYRNFEIWCNSI